MAQKDTRDLAKDELHKAVRYFVERQQLVVQAMLDMKLDIDVIGRFGALSWILSRSSENGQKPLDGFGNEPANEHEKEIYEILKRSAEIRVPRKGEWKDKSGQEWNYILHGNGCLLVNPETEEPIDWDCPNPKAFDIFFFRRHLDWRLKQGDNEIKHVRESYSEFEFMFSELVEGGLIRACQMPMGLVYILKDEES